MVYLISSPHQLELVLELDDLSLKILDNLKIAFFMWVTAAIFIYEVFFELEIESAYLFLTLLILFLEYQ